MKKLSKVSIIVILMFSAFSLSFTKEVSAGIADEKFLGNIISHYVPSDFGVYWDQVTPENSTKWGGSVESTRDNMNWTNADTSYNFAKSNGYPFKFHTLVWGGSQEPSWVSGLSTFEQRAELLEWIQASAQRYGDAEYIDVVNEPLHAPLLLIKMPLVAMEQLDGIGLYGLLNKQDKPFLMQNYI